MGKSVIKGSGTAATYNRRHIKEKAKEGFVPIPGLMPNFREDRRNRLQRLIRFR